MKKSFIGTEEPSRSSSPTSSNNDQEGSDLELKAFKDSKINYLSYFQVNTLASTYL